MLQRPLPRSRRLGFEHSLFMQLLKNDFGVDAEFDRAFLPVVGLRTGPTALSECASHKLKGRRPFARSSWRMNDWVDTPPLY